LEAQSASTHQISLKSDDFRLRYSDKTIFKMEAVDDDMYIGGRSENNIKYVVHDDLG